MASNELNKPHWHVPIAVGVLILKEDRIFMLKRIYKDWGYGVVAGELKKGETLPQSVVRYAKKEVGITIDKDDLSFLCFVHYKTEDEKESPVVFFFTTKKWIGDPFNKEPEKYSEARWFNLNQLPDHLAPGENLVLDAYKYPKCPREVYFERGWDDKVEL
jgi:ADP-ribose pyrophosphatase YjhB (NUDIX family)